MRRIGIRQFRANITNEMTDLPFAITKNGKVIGIMISPKVPEPVLRPYPKSSQTDRK